LNKRFEQEKRRNKEKRKEWRRAWQQQAADVADKLHEHIGNLSNAHMLRKRAAKPAETLVAITRTTKKNYRTHQKTRINKDGEDSGWCDSQIV
jgi:phosphoglycerate-specific signal transduction histidine kinase